MGSKTLQDEAPYSICPDVEGLVSWCLMADTVENPVVVGR
jgi:hypothetical protein